jgi:hypothetical protein
MAELPTGHLVDVRLLQVVDVLGDLAEGGRDHAQQQHELGDPVAGGLHRDHGLAQSELLHEAFLDLKADGPEGRQRAHRAAELTHEDARAGLPQTLLLPVHLVQPNRRLEAEGDGNGVLAMGAARHDRVPVGLRQMGERVPDGVQVIDHQPVGVLDLEHQTGVEDVLARGAPMHVPGGRGRDHLTEGVDERDHRIPGSVEFRLHRLEVESVDAGGSGDLLRLRGRNDTELGFGLGQRRLDIEPALLGPPIFPDGPHGRGPEAITKIEGIEGCRAHIGCLPCV